MNNKSEQIIEVTNRIKVIGRVDQPLLDHLGYQSERAFRELCFAGEATPNDAASLERYQETEILLDGVESKLVSPALPVLSNRDTAIVLAALRHFQSAIETDTDLSYLSDIMEPGTVFPHEIDVLCEDINCSVLTPIQLAIHLEGGLIQNVIAKEIPSIPIDIAVFDYDIDNVGDDEITPVTQADGRKVGAYIMSHNISDQAACNLDDIFTIFD